MEDRTNENTMSRRSFLKNATGTAVYQFMPFKHTPDMSEHRPSEVLPIVIKVETLNQLEQLFRSHDARYIPPNKRLKDMSEPDIRESRQRHVSPDDPFRTTIVISADMYNLIQQQGEDTIGTNSPAEYFTGMNAFWKQMCAYAQVSSNYQINRIVLVQDPQMYTTTMERLNSEGNGDSPPWRSHTISNREGKHKAIITEPLDTDQTLFFPIKMAEDHYPITQNNTTIQLGKKHITVDVGAVHEWYGHTAGKGTKLVGCFGDLYWYNIREKPLSDYLNHADTGLKTDINMVYFELSSIMNSGKVLTPSDLTQSVMRGRYLPKYGGIHADGLPIFTWEDGQINDIFELRPRNGYRIVAKTRDGEDITNTVFARTFKLPSKLNNNPRLAQSIQFNEVGNYSPDTLSGVDYLLFANTDSKVVLTIPKPIFTFATAAQMNNPAYRTDLNITFNDIVDNDAHSHNFHDMYIQSYQGEIDPERIKDNEGVLAWTTIHVGNNPFTDANITYVWTNDQNFQMPRLQNKSKGPY